MTLKTRAALATALGAALWAAPAVAFQAPAAPTTGDLATPVASWRYAANCGWRGNRWVLDLGNGRVSACRPNRPGRNYVWHRDGGREGWYDRRQRDWHYKQY